jgi:hypothetical protein
LDDGRDGKGEETARFALFPDCGLGRVANMFTRSFFSSFSIPAASAVALLLQFTGTAAVAQMVASNDRVRIEAKLTTDTDRKDLDGTTTDTVTQKKSIIIKLTGKAKTPETRVV